MLRATKKLIRQLFCLNLKKAKNQRRVVIIVALIGVYYLGKHSSSVNVRNKEGQAEKPRRPRDNDTVERAKQIQQERVDKLVPIAMLGLYDPRDKASSKVIEKVADTDHEVEQVAKVTGEVSTDSTSSKPNQVTPSFSAEQTNVKKPQQTDENRKTNKQPVDDIHASPMQLYSDHKSNQTAVQPNVGQEAPSKVTSKKSLAQTDQSKLASRTVQTSPQKDKVTSSRAASPEGSTSSDEPPTAPVLSKGVSNYKDNRHLQGLLKDKNLFGFVGKNATDQLWCMHVLKTASYSEFLQYQISRRRSKPKKPGSQKSDDDFSLIYKYGYSKKASDKLPLLRSLPDNRDSRCKDEQYGSNKLDISVITVLQSNDAVSLILRMLLSVLHHTPQQVLREIILVNDGVTWDKEESNLLQLFLKRLPKVHMINHNTSVGLARCMNRAAKMANGHVLAFLSPKTEVTEDWHVALLAWLAENPNDMVLPVIVPIHWNTIEYSKSKIPVQIRGGFTWGLTFRWKIIPDDEKQRRQNLPVELRTPVYNGAIILMNRIHYNTLLGANEAIDGHDSTAIAMELSLKQWMCGGMILTIPCSRVGFMYIMESPVLSSYMIKNRVAIAESLMDDYKGHFYNTHLLVDKAISEKFNASIETTKALRQKLHCLSFKWYMENIFYDKKEPRANSQYAGLIRGAEMCVDASSYTVGRPASCRVCRNHSITQLFDLDDSGVLIFDEDFILGQRKPSAGSSIEVLKRRTMSKSQAWRYDPKTIHLVHATSGLCMSCVKGILTLVMCDDTNRDTQGWKFDWERPS